MRSVALPIKPEAAAPAAFMIAASAKALTAKKVAKETGSITIIILSFVKIETNNNHTLFNLTKKSSLRWRTSSTKLPSIIHTCPPSPFIYTLIYAIFIIVSPDGSRSPRPGEN